MIDPAKEPTKEEVLEEMGFPRDFLDGFGFSNFQFDPAPLEISSQEHREWNGVCEYEGEEYLIGFDHTQGQYRIVFGPAGDIPKKTVYKDDPRKLKQPFKETVESA